MDETTPRKKIPEDGKIKIPVLNYPDTPNGPGTGEILMCIEELDVGGLVSLFGEGAIDEIGHLVKENNKPEAMLRRWQKKQDNKGKRKVDE